MFHDKISDVSNHIRINLIKTQRSIKRIEVANKTSILFSRLQL
ncbi:hypothetical protein J2T02_005657 [Chitinophaga terrae (ex Kim and Jung 2007)]|nr:hypothetical protein [Chitinophaga terrae (ex Kim and Jung 2007)]